MKFILIRHGKTQGNLERRYIGCRTDEALCAEGMEELRRRVYPDVRRVFSSPMLRCVQTAGILFPGKRIQIIDDLRECDFGEFENRNYEELKDNPAYQAWIDSGGEAPFPGGESRRCFAQRCVRAFGAAVQGLPEGSYAFVAHGGMIMAVMERFAQPRGDYYDFQARNGEGFILNVDGSYEELVL